MKPSDSIELEKRIESLAESCGFRLVSANWAPIRGKLQLRVVADAEDHNITVDECADLSRFICDLLDSYPHEFPDYRLEVSSPGLKAPLERWQFNKNIDRKVEVRFEEAGKSLNFRGKLSEVTSEGFAVSGKAEDRKFKYSDVKGVIVLPIF